jgi:hypothetical protein
VFFCHPIRVVTHITLMGAASWHSQHPMTT